MGYTKLFSDIVCSSIWNEDDKTRLVWVTMLALKGGNHVVRATIGGLAHAARVSIEDCKMAIQKLSGPDPDGLDQPYEGRRIEPIEHGWFVLNGESYQQRRDEIERKKYQADWVKNKRLKEKRRLSTLTVSTDVENVDPSSLLSSDKTKQNKENPPTPLQGELVFPDSLKSEEFQKAWSEWGAHRKQIKKRMTPLQEQKLLKQLEAWGAKRAIAAIEYSIANGWRGIFEPEVTATTAKTASPRFVTKQMVDDWCYRNNCFNGISKEAWGRLMDGKWKGQLITNKEDFEAAMGTIKANWEMRP
jgi:hypothetical protein